MATYSARQLGILLGLNEKTIRTRLKNGYYPGAKKLNPTLWAIPDEVLEPYIRPRDLVTRIDELERRVMTMENQLKRLLSASIQSVTRYEGQETALDHTAIQGYSARPLVTALPVRSATASEEFKTRNDAARWLANHGINFQTARFWQGLPLTQSGALQFALDHVKRAGYRAAAVHIRQCFDSECVCRKVLVMAQV